MKGLDLHVHVIRSLLELHSPAKTWRHHKGLPAAPGTIKRCFKPSGVRVEARGQHTEVSHCTLSVCEVLPSVSHCIPPFLSDVCLAQVYDGLSWYPGPSYDVKAMAV